MPDNHPSRRESEQPSEHHAQLNGVELCWFEWQGAATPDNPTIVMAHATGFHARCWDQVIRLLPEFHVIAVDFRGHGRSAKPEPPYGWKDFGQDLVALVSHLELQDAIGVGHSMGGHSVIYTALHANRNVFAKMLLVDPVIKVDSSSAPPGESTTSFVAKRRNYWSSTDEFVDHFKEKIPYSLWQEKVLIDYAEYGLLANPEPVLADQSDVLELACPPVIEAAIYAGAGDSSFGSALGDINSEVLILRAKKAPPESKGGFLYSPTSPELSERFRLGTDVYLEEMTHFIPMQDPILVAERLRGMLR